LALHGRRLLSVRGTKSAGEAAAVQVTTTRPKRPPAPSSPPPRTAAALGPAYDDRITRQRCRDIAERPMGQHAAGERQETQAWPTR
jgi:hypothetical protein